MLPFPTLISSTMLRNGTGIKEPILKMRMMNADKTPIRLFNIYGEDRGTGYAGNVWGVEGIAPALTTMGGKQRTNDN